MPAGQRKVTIFTVLPLDTYAEQVFPIGPIAIPDGVTQVGASFLRETSADTSIWNDPAQTISYDFDTSSDGVAYDHWFDGGPEPGGIHTNKLGAEIPTMPFLADIPPGAKWLKGSVTFVGTIKTQCDVTVI